MIFPLDYWQLLQPTIFWISQTWSDRAISNGMLTWAHLKITMLYVPVCVHVDKCTYVYEFTCVYVLCAHVNTQKKCVHTSELTDKIMNIIICIYRVHVYTVFFL